MSVAQADFIIVDDEVPVWVQLQSAEPSSQSGVRCLLIIP